MPLWHKGVSFSADSKCTAETFSLANTVELTIEKVASSSQKGQTTLSVAPRRSESPYAPLFLTFWRTNFWFLSISIAVLLINKPGSKLANESVLATVNSKARQPTDLFTRSVSTQVLAWQSYRTESTLIVSFGFWLYTIDSYGVGIKPTHF